MTEKPADNGTLLPDSPQHASLQNETRPGLQMKYFVLKPKGDDIYAQASRRAMFAYAKTIIEENRVFARNVWDWATDEAIAANEELLREIHDRSRP